MVLGNLDDLTKQSIHPVPDLEVIFLRLHMDIAGAIFRRPTQDQIHESNDRRHLGVPRQLSWVDDLNFSISNRFHLALDISRGKSALMRGNLVRMNLVDQGLDISLAGHDGDHSLAGTKFHILHR